MGYIHMIRHGLTEANKTKKFYGSSDVPLANEGIDQVVDLAKAGVYPMAEGAHLYTTGMIRTEQTFFLIYGCQDHHQIEELREYHFGDFELKTYNQLSGNPDFEAWYNDKKGLTPCPNGESPQDFKNRVSQGFAKIFERHKRPDAQNEKTIIVCHGGVISVIMGLCFPHKEKNIFQWQPDPGRGFSIHINDGEATSYEDI